MLASITPLGERSRGFSWRLTVAAFAVGAVSTATVAGALAGAAGSLAPDGAWRSRVALGVIAIALAYDATPLRRRLPTTRRQVNEDWMARYRGWVYGAAFGSQLGVGVATVVTSAAIYAAALGALLCGTIASGALVGAAFGVTRALSLAPSARASDAAGLLDLHQALVRLQSPARWVPVAGELIAAGLLIGGLA